MSAQLATASPRRIKASHRRRRRIASGQSVQRYYDPLIGRFLSVDPVAANSGTGANFNRYWYANNNPYRFTDPDGRQSWPTPQNFNVDMSKQVPNDVSNSWKMAEQAAAPKTVYATGTLGTMTGGAGVIGGNIQGPTGTVAYGKEGLCVSGSLAQGQFATPLGGVVVGADANGVQGQPANVTAVGAGAGLFNYSVGISSLPSASTIDAANTRTFTIPGISVTVGESKSGWFLGISIMKPAVEASYIKAEEK